MAETQKPKTLSALFTEMWDALSPEDKEKSYYAMWPDSAYFEILRLRGICTANNVRAESLFKISSEVLGLLKKEQRRKKAYFEIAIKLKRAQAKRLDALDTEAAHQANTQRATQVMKAIRNYVFERIKQQHLLTVKELTNEIRKTNWANKNKDGVKLSESYLLSVVRPLVKKAKIAARNEGV